MDAVRHGDEHRRGAHQPKTRRFDDGNLADAAPAFWRVRLYKDYSEETERAVQELHSRMDDLCVEDDPCPKGKLLKQIQAEVNEQYPQEWFWWPPDSEPIAVAATETAL